MIHAVAEPVLLSLDVEDVALLGGLVAADIGKPLALKFKKKFTLLSPIFIETFYTYLVSAVPDFPSLPDQILQSLRRDGLLVIERILELYTFQLVRLSHGNLWTAGREGRRIESRLLLSVDRFGDVVEGRGGIGGLVRFLVVDEVEVLLLLGLLLLDVDGAALVLLGKVGRFAGGLGKNIKGFGGVYAKMVPHVYYVPDTVLAEAELPSDRPLRCTRPGPGGRDRCNHRKVAPRSGRPQSCRAHRGRPHRWEGPG